jgi:site-specific recombinase XerD
MVKAASPGSSVNHGPTEAKKHKQAARARSEDERPDLPSLLKAWGVARADWLQLLQNRSPHTARSYAKALADFDAFIQACYDIPLWRVDPAHVRAWREQLQADGKSASTIAQRMAAVISFYAFVIAEKRQAAEGIGLYVDDRNKWRCNPFRVSSLDRPKIRKFARSRTLPVAVVESMLRRINTGTPTGARDYALLLTLLYTGWRAKEVLSLRWGDVGENPDQPGGYLCRWPEGPRSTPAALPARCYQAILLYLCGANRPPDQLQHEVYLWQPLHTCGCANLLHVRELAANRPITTAQANNILRKRLRAAGLAEYRTYTLQCLRNTFAQAYAKTKDGDVAGLSRRLHHTRIATTQAYLNALESFEDDYSAAFEQMWHV